MLIYCPTFLILTVVCKQKEKMEANSIKIPRINFQEFLIPKMEIRNGELYRIELGISHGTKRQLLNRILEKECKELKIATVNNLKTKIRLKYFFKSKTVNDYLEEKGILKEGIYKLIQICKNCQPLKIDKETKLADLTEQEFRLIKIFVLLNHNKKIFIETSGMYLSALVGTYEILKDFLNNGGIVIELAYPHFDETDELKWSATRNLKSIQIGEMKILN